MIYKTILALAVFWMAVFPLHSLQDENPLREKVETVNMEVPVRVFADGKAVTDLNREDFLLYEGGMTQKINGFYFIRKTIAGPPPAAAEVRQAPASRYFVLAFRVHEFNEPLREGLAHVFSKVLRAEDQLLVFINNRAREYMRLIDMERIRSEIEEELRRECHSAKNNMLVNLKKIEDEGNLIRMKLGGFFANSTKPSLIAHFLEKYIDIWKTYKQKYLGQDIDRYFSFAAHLGRIKKEKWVINFYQLELFPKMSASKELRQTLEKYVETFNASTIPEDKAGAISLSRTLREIDLQMNANSDTSAKEISQLFSRVNATFHTIFIKTQIDALSENYECQQIASSIEDNLRELTAKTGGKLLTSTNIAASLDSVSASEDCLYVLTFAPANPNRIGKIKVETTRGIYDLLYDDNQRADYINAYLERKKLEDPVLQLQGLSFAERKLSLGLNGFKMQSKDGKTMGIVKVRIRVVSAAGQTVFDNGRILEALKEPFSLAVGFGFLPAGKYDIIVDAQDLLSGKSCTDFVQPVIN